jgi:hypothetical protein
MGAGLHGLNGLNPKVSIHIIRIYVIPRLIYGLETIRIAAADLTGINMYFKRLLKQIQHLPERTSDAATYLLHGQIPITGEIHKRALTTFGNIIRDFGTVESQILRSILSYSLVQFQDVLLCHLLLRHCY